MCHSLKIAKINVEWGCSDNCIYIVFAGTYGHAAIIVSVFYLQAHMTKMAKDSVERGHSNNCICILFEGTYG